MSALNKLKNGISICAFAGLGWLTLNDVLTHHDDVQHIPQRYSALQKAPQPLNAQQCFEYSQKLLDSLANLDIPRHSDKEMLQKALAEWINSKTGQYLIANMRPDIHFELDTNTPYRGSYSDTSRTITLSRILTRSTRFEDSIQGMYAQTLSHETFHAYQHQQGLINPFGLSPEQFMTHKKLYEAEAMVQGLLEHVIQSYNLRGDKENIDTFLTLGELNEDDYSILEDLREQYENTPPERKNTFFAPEDIAENTEKRLKTMRELSPMMALYDQLKTGISLEEARSKAAGVMIKHYVGSKTPPELEWWQKFYDKGFLKDLRYFALEGKISKDGNKAAYNDILKYYETKYGLQRDEIDHTGSVHKDNKWIIQKNIRWFDKNGYFISMENIIEQDTEKANKQLRENLKNRLCQFIILLTLLPIANRLTSDEIKEEKNEEDCSMYGVTKPSHQVNEEQSRSKVIHPPHKKETTR